MKKPKPGPGRPPGTGTGSTVARVGVTLAPAQIKYIDKRGKGNRSAGARAVIDDAIKNLDSKPPQGKKDER